jgi:hypothetical protein
MDTTIEGDVMTAQKAETDNTVILARLEEKIDGIDTKVEDINKKLYGNGHPGIIVDQALQNKQIEDLLEKEKKNCENIKSLIESNPNKWLAKNWIKIIMIATLFFVLIHSLMPEGVTIWQLLALIK